MATPDWNKHTFLKICGQHHYVPKVAQNARKIVNVSLEKSHEDSHIACIEGGANDDPSTPNLVEKAMLSGQLKDFLEGVSCNEE